MAGPLRFRRSHDHWDLARLRRDLYEPLDASIGARLTTPWFKPPRGYTGRRLEMDNGDRALFVWNDDAFWLGNTQTPEALWRTEKYDFTEVPYPVSRWAQRELLAELELQDPWLARYEHLSWFFLPVFFSKDGRESTRTFFADHAAGFPDADRDAALGFYERFLSTGVLDDYRYTMASKLGTSERLDRTRMSATMAEFNAAKLLADAGYAVRPEIELDSGYALDFRATRDGESTLVEVTRPSRPTGRAADTPTAAARETALSKTDGQLAAHPGTVLFVDCSSFRDDEWAALTGERSGVGYRPAVVFRARPDGSITGYCDGEMALDLTAAGIDP
ncbi:DUF5784 family protein [Halococcus thailandensis]|uniref:Uncharacterized protein n=1 Tax=Halococcus thailandensis JCM 13552 TaxID=1227457 RepID=M0N7C2_9EURY|nr:DUF5784 family protein [Halococcus thailandensis]EMA53776.1 hypothetical protein C451_09140 [Halococcus thailandensis JCM 13552]